MWKPNAAFCMLVNKLANPRRAWRSLGFHLLVCLGFTKLGDECTMYLENTDLWHPPSIKHIHIICTHRIFWSTIELKRQTKAVWEDYLQMKKWKNTCTPTHLFIRNCFLNDQIWKFVVPLWSANEMSFQDKRQERRRSHKTLLISWSWQWTSICKTLVKDENKTTPNPMYSPLSWRKTEQDIFWTTSLGADQGRKKKMKKRRLAIDKVQVILEAYETSNPPFLLGQSWNTQLIQTSYC